MIKKFIPVFLTVCLLFCCCFSLPSYAYRINEYEMHHKAGMLVYTDDDTVIYSNDADKRMYPASITKLMTAIVMAENISDWDNTVITYTSSANDLILGTGSVVLNLKVGEEISARDALAALLIPSCGDVAYAIAENIGGTVPNFVQMMNDKAAELGMNDTHFVNPVGLHDDNHYTTANDIYKMARVAFKNAEIKKYSSMSRCTLSATNLSGERTIVTSNMLLNPNSDAYYRYAVAGKTGYTDAAGRCLVATASYKGYEYMAIVLNADTSGGVRNDFKDVANMFRWAFNNFEYKTVFDDSTPITEAPISLSRETDYLPICFEGGLKALLPTDADASTVSYQIKLNKTEFSAPVKKGDIVGTADIFYAEEQIGTLNLIAADTVDSDPLLVFVSTAKSFFTSTLMKIVYLAVIIAIIIFIVAVILLNVGKKKSKRAKYVPLSRSERRDLDDK